MHTSRSLRKIFSTKMDFSSVQLSERVEDAANVCRRAGIRQSPLLTSHEVDRHVSALLHDDVNVFFKCEHQQVTGTVKVTRNRAGHFFSKIRFVQDRLRRAARASLLMLLFARATSDRADSSRIRVAITARRSLGPRPWRQCHAALSYRRTLPYKRSTASKSTAPILSIALRILHQGRKLAKQLPTSAAIT